MTQSEIEKSRTSSGKEPVNTYQPPTTNTNPQGNLTYQNFQDQYNAYNKYAGENGLEGMNFSDADLALAKNNANAGMALFNAKLQWAKANSDAARAAANAEAERIRRQFGNYTAGKDGSGYRPGESLTPNSFAYDDAPAFSYDMQNDPVYQAYAKQYAREGKRATQNAMGAAASATGGIPSSYAATAAAQAGNYYASQMSDKVPQLYDQAYGRYQNQLSQYNTDRNFKYNQFTDQINYNAQQRQEALQKEKWNHQLEQDKFQQDYNISSLAGKYGDYGKLKELFGIMVKNDPANASMQYNLAVAKAQEGDYTLINQLAAKYFS